MARTSGLEWLPAFLSGREYLRPGANLLNLDSRDEPGVSGWHLRPNLQPHLVSRIDIRPFRVSVELPSPRPCADRQVGHRSTSDPSNLRDRQSLAVETWHRAGRESGALQRDAPGSPYLSTRSRGYRPLKNWVYSKAYLLPHHAEASGAALAVSEYSLSAIPPPTSKLMQGRGDRF